VERDAMSEAPDPNVHTVESTPVLTEHAVSVLLVDDQPIIGEAVRRMLVTQGDIQFRYCNDPTKAVEMAKEAHTSVILSDLVMPQLDGIELVRRFRADPKTRQIPLIVLSTKEEAATKAEAFSSGANDYLVKLPDPVELIARIRHHSNGYISLLQRDEAYHQLEVSRQAMADDLDQAARYVQSLLPEPTKDRVEVDWRFIPSASLGGDAFGYQWVDDDHFAIYLLDVSGHGVGSALLGVSVMTTLNAHTLPATDFKDPGAVLSALNEAFRTEDHGGKFFTIWYGVYQASTRMLRYAGAGHPPALYFPDPNTAVAPASLESTGPMPGVLRGLTFATREQELAPGSRIFIYSDGVYELREATDRVRTHEEFVQFLVEPGHRNLTEIRAGAEAVVAPRAFDDDVSLVQADFP
jgi:sigma-B regulation protein RsbU (phosphoserine phosphatase)